MLNRRRLLSSLAMIPAFAASVRYVSAQPTSSAAPPMSGMAAGTMSLQTCVDSCWRSHVMCLETERYCLEKGGMHVMPVHLTLLADCAEMCQKTANSLLRRSPQHAAVCIAKVRGNERGRADGIVRSDLPRLRQPLSRDEQIADLSSTIRGGKARLPGPVRYRRY